MKYFRILPLSVFAVALLWHAALVTRFHSSGALGTDPATYVQMALDLAQHQTITHEFPLLTNLFEKGFSWDAFITPGYHVVRETGFVAPNFAFGFPLLLALVYRAFGESALYWATPLLGMLSLGMTFALANELFREVPTPRRHWIGAVAALLLATSPKQIQLVLVPMSDVPTQLFCQLAMWFALLMARPQRSPAQLRNDARVAVNHADAPGAAPAWKRVRHYVYAALCGLSLGTAFLIRPSAAALLVPLAVVVTGWRTTRRTTLVRTLFALAFFALAILPNFIYGTRVLGSPFAVPSPESAVLVWSDAPRQLGQMVAALFSVTGFGPLAVLAPFGWWLFAREKNGFVATVLMTWVLGFMVLHAPLFLTGVFENNLRYLLPAYPALVLSISYGAVRLVEITLGRIRNAQARYSTRSFLLYATALFLGAGVLVATRALADPTRFVSRAYGWMDETTRRDLEALAQQLPQDAVIGTSDQMAGAALLYTQRDIFRPASFLEPTREFPRLVELMKNDNRTIFLLGDWNCTADADASARLPAWLAEYQFRDWRLEIRDLPFGCTERLYQVE